MNLPHIAGVFRFAMRILISGCFMFSSLTLHAYNSHSIELTGTVERIDFNSQFLIVKPDTRGESLLLRWGRWTSFVKGEQLISAKALCTGRARIFYKTPFFGKPILVKIIIQGNLFCPDPAPGCQRRSGEPAHILGGVGE